jgi:hypothetical protein
LKEGAQFSRCCITDKKDIRPTEIDWAFRRKFTNKKTQRGTSVEDFPHYNTNNVWMTLWRLPKFRVNRPHFCVVATKPAERQEGVCFHGFRS